MFGQQYPPNAGHEYAFSHPPPLPLNAYSAESQQQPPTAAAPSTAPVYQQQQLPKQQQQYYAQGSTSANISPEANTGALPAIAQQQQAQAYGQPQNQAEYVDAALYQAQNMVPVEYQQQQQQQQFVAGGAPIDFAEFQTPGEYSQAMSADYHHQQQFVGHPYDEQDHLMNGGMMGMIPGVKRARGEKISSKDFIPPDVTGLTKREARLVKNRAAAFLSRQRKREEFEAMELRVADLESQNATLLAQLAGTAPGAGDSVHLAHVRALQARIGSLEHELSALRQASRSPSPLSSNGHQQHHRTNSYDSFESSLSGSSAGGSKMTADEKQAVIGMGLMALLSLSSMSPESTKFVFAPADNADEPTPVTATPFNYDSIARWQERLAAASSLPTVSGSPPDGSAPLPSTSSLPEATKDASTNAEFDIAFSTTNDGRIRCHVSVPRAQLARMQSQHHPVHGMSASQMTATGAIPLPTASPYLDPSSSFPATPYSYASNLSSGAHSTHSLSGIQLGASPDSMPGSHPGSASSYHSTFEAAGYNVSVAPVSVVVPEDAWVAQHQAQQWAQQQQQGQNDWQNANPITPIAPRPPVQLPVKQESGSSSGSPPRPHQQQATETKQLGPKRRVRVALRAQNGRGEWEVEVC